MEHTYADRNRTLRSIGYNTYKDYLNSDLWKRIRERALREHGDKCRLCESPVQVFHHRGYGKAVLLGYEIKQLVPLCSKCHTKVEFWPNKKKRTLQEAHSAFVRLWKHVKYRKKQQIKEEKRAAYLRAIVERIEARESIHP